MPGERTSLSDLRRCARTRAAVHGRPLRRLPQDCPERIAPRLLADVSAHGSSKRRLISILSGRLTDGYTERRDSNTEKPFRNLRGFLAGTEREEDTSFKYRDPPHLPVISQIWTRFLPQLGSMLGLPHPARFRFVHAYPCPRLAGA